MKCFQGYFFSPSRDSLPAISLAMLSLCRHTSRKWAAAGTGTIQSTSANNCAALIVSFMLASVTAAPAAKGCNTHRPSAPLR